MGDPGRRLVDYLETVTRRERQGTSHGLSIRVARDLCYRPSAFRSRPIGWEETVHAGTGMLGLTTKHIYFAGRRKRFRVRYDRIVAFEPHRDGLGIMRDAQTAKPQSFVTGDGWFVYNLAANPTQMYTRPRSLRWNWGKNWKRRLTRLLTGGVDHVEKCPVCQNREAPIMYQMSPLLRGPMVCPVCHAQGLLEAEPGHQGYVIRTAAMDAYAAGNRNEVEKQSRCIAAYVKIKNGVDVSPNPPKDGVWDAC